MTTGAIIDKLVNTFQLLILQKKKTKKPVNIFKIKCLLNISSIVLNLE